MKTLIAIFGGTLLYWICALLYLGVFNSGMRSTFADVSESNPKPLKAYARAKDIVTIYGNVTEIDQSINVGSKYHPEYQHIKTEDRCGIFTFENKYSKYRFKIGVYTYTSTSRDTKDNLVTSIPQKDDDYMHIEISDGSCSAHITLDKHETHTMLYG
ncbi:MAG: hypothetical protein ABF979_14475 [Gluconobacter sp.]|uniref:hypothetical protein n=1 Tax=Gluconobacter sp. TaxID=1876758 RepID=UPI0039E8B8EE